MPKRAKAIRPPPVDSRPKNKLLGCLPRADFDRLRPRLKTIPIKVRQILHPVNEPVRDVYFLNGGVGVHDDGYAGWLDGRNRHRG